MLGERTVSPRLSRLSCLSSLHRAGQGSAQAGHRQATGQADNTTVNSGTGQGRAVQGLAQSGSALASRTIAEVRCNIGKIGARPSASRWPLARLGRQQLAGTPAWGLGNGTSGQQIKKKIKGVEKKNCKINYTMHTPLPALLCFLACQQKQNTKYGGRAKEQKSNRAK